MTPRKYRLGKRARGVARTRLRIVEAAMSLYRDQPVESTSMQEVARRADVSPATVLNHFERPELLTEAVVDELLRRLEPPSPAIFGGVAGVSERLAVLAGSLSRFFERAEPWYALHEREHGRVPAFARGAREFDERVLALVEEALGAHADERGVLAVRTLLSPTVLGNLRVRGGLSADGAAELVVELLMSWLATRSMEEAVHEA